MADSDLIEGINAMLEGPLGEVFEYDLTLARTKGRIILCYRETGSPIPLELALTEDAMKSDKLNWREVHRAVKECLPDNIIKQCISEAKTLARMMNRRNLKDAERDLKAWRAKTEKRLIAMFGVKRVEGFNAEVLLPADIRPGSLHALHFAFDVTIDRLNDF